MKIIAIGDTHGRSFWKLIVHTHTFDKLVFIWDYCDSFDIPAEEQLRNFPEMVAYREAHPEKVTLLAGNYDLHYLPVARTMNEAYSGFQERYAFQIGHLLQQHGNLLQACCRLEEYLFSHAGITQTWLESTGFRGDKIVNYVNDLFRYKPQKFLFNGKDPYGDDVTQSPLWVRPRSLREDALHLVRSGRWWGIRLCINWT